MKPAWSVALAAFLAACQPTGQNSQAPDPGGATAANEVPGDLCAAEATPIATVQGRSFGSPLAGREVTVRGVITHIVPGEGLFLQDPQPASSAQVSHGLFIASPGLSEHFPRGVLLALRGRVAELGQSDDTLTAIVDVGHEEHCGRGPEPPVFDARLPLNAEEREAFESMQVLLEQPLTVTEAKDVAEGVIMVSALGLLRAPTEVTLPGPEAIAHEHKNRDWSLPVQSEGLRDLEPYTRMHAGALIHVASGVLGHDGRQLALLAQGELGAVARPAPTVPAAADGLVRVASFNLYEYFNGDGRGGGFPGERGARSGREFERQARRITAAIAEIRPDILAVQELENDGFGPESAIQHLARAISEAVGAEYRAAIPRADRAGTDVIAAGLLYRSDRVEAQGPARLLEGGSFGPLNRVPVAQRFRHPDSGIDLVVVSNHLKSKGFCPDSGPDLDQGDGQACWNATRVEGARETLAWARDLAAEAGTTHFVLLGDFNAYRQEDPVRALLADGAVELVAHHHPDMPQYSYIFRGAGGTLDYAFASSSLAELSAAALIWHINAAYPWSGRPSEPWLRSSDHDPVVVDFRFSQAATSD